MSERPEQTLQAINDGKRLVIVQDDDVSTYVDEMSKREASGDSPRAVIEWDSLDGFLPPRDYMDELPETDDFLAALDCVRSFLGRAVFVLDATAVDFADGEAQIRKQLRQIDSKAGANNEINVVLVVAHPIPESIASRHVWIGDPIDRKSKGRRSSSKSRSEYDDFRNIDKFDTSQWASRIDQMTIEEAAEIIKERLYTPSLDRFNDLRSQLKSRFARKDDIVDAICAASIAQVPTVLIGPPGTAKSNLIRCFCEGLGLTARTENNGSASRGYFEYLLTRYTTPEEIFGPIHVQDLIEHQIYRRVTDGYLPEAKIAFLDEIFKASSAILNTLLTLLNERIFYNAGQATKSPLMMVFAASNEAPADEGLQALYDRFPLRLNCQSIDDDHVDELLNASWSQAFDRQFGSQQTAVEKLACANDLRLLRHVMRLKFGGRKTESTSDIGANFSDEFLRFFRSLRSDFGISDRTVASLLAFCRAQALLGDGHHGEKSELTTAELDVFRHVIWDESGMGELDRMVSNMKRGVHI